MKLATRHRNDTGLPDAPVLVLLHGVFGCARNLGQLQRGLASQFNTYTLDLRAHGKSPHGLLTYPAMAEDVIETFDALKLEKVSLLGHSMGGKVSMVTTLLAPQRIKKLVVADMVPAPIIRGQGDLARIMAALSLPALHNRQEIRNFLLPFTKGDLGIADLLGQHIRPGDPAIWTIGLQDINASFADIEGWPAASLTHKFWDGPALFLRGGASDYVTPEHYPAIQHYFPRAEIETLPEAGHWLHVEQPEAFLKTVSHFLEETSPAITKRGSR